MAGNQPPDNYDESSFKELFDTYLKRVYDYIGAISRSGYIAEEVVQELFIILWRKRHDLHEVQNMDQYIFRIARNLAINLLKKAAVDSKMAAEFYKRSLKQSPLTGIEVNFRGVQSLIDKAVMELPPQPQKVYFLSRRENMSFDEIASEMGLSRNTIKNHLQKALHEIRKYLVQHGYQQTLLLLLFDAWHR
jgi:RNA polymerase sigma-70 factor (ECF subfamily)